MPKTKGLLLIDVQGTSLSPEDVAVLSHPAVCGVVLFQKNYDNPAQLADLCAAIHAVKPALWITVDQEGGRVQRFKTGFSELAPLSDFGRWYDNDPAAATQGLITQTKIMVSELQACGIDMTLHPVLDLDFGLSAIIGTRSLHRDPTVVTQLAGQLITTMRAMGMPSMGKHFPGHGGVVPDSHVALPIEERSLAALWEEDMLPYRRLLEQLDAVMLSHVRYPDVDELPASLSPVWINILRQQLGYTGLIVTDCLSMAAIASEYDPLTRAGLAFEAGCDVLIWCNERSAVLTVLEQHDGGIEPTTAGRFARVVPRP